MTSKNIPTSKKVLLNVFTGIECYYSENATIESTRIASGR